MQTLSSSGLRYISDMLYRMCCSSAGLGSGNRVTVCRHIPVAAVSLSGNLLQHVSPAVAAMAAATMHSPQPQLRQCRSLPEASVTGHHMAWCRTHHSCCRYTVQRPASAQLTRHLSGNRSPLVMAALCVPLHI
jgi:hypothetical protein